MEPARPRILDEFPTPVAYSCALIFDAARNPSVRRWALCFTEYQTLRLIALLVARLVRGRDLTLFAWITSDSERPREDEGAKVVVRVASSVSFVSSVVSPVLRADAGGKAIVRVVVIVQCQPDLFQVIDALRPPRRLARRLDCVQPQSNERRDDRDHDQEFDEGESAPGHWLSSSNRASEARPSPGLRALAHSRTPATMMGRILLTIRRGNRKSKALLIAGFRAWYDCQSSRHVVSRADVREAGDPCECTLHDVDANAAVRWRW
jgi:hypothetical protein